MNKAEYAKYKRCMEWYCTDPVFRKKMDASPEDAIRDLGYEQSVNCDEVYYAIRWIMFRDAKEGINVDDNRYVVAYKEHIDRVKNNLYNMGGYEGFNNKKLFFYERIIRNRCHMENRLLRSNNMIRYFPFSFELSLGCSVQCPFCGLAAEKHQGDFLYTDENARLFREILQIAYEYAGPILSRCPLYFATEPFDNPDYEKFVMELCRLSDIVPQTTTALADKYPDRIHRMIKTLGDKAVEENAALRISIRTISQFKKIANEFSPEELAYVELLPNNLESVHRYSNSGRTLENANRLKKKARTNYSISCVSGMKVNLVKKTVEFIEPEVPDETYPLGHRVRELCRFDTAEDFVNIVKNFDERYVHDRLPYHLPVCFNKNVRIEKEDNRFVFKGDATGYQIGRNDFIDQLIFEIENNSSFIAAISKMHLPFADEKRLYDAMNALYIRGYIRIC